MGNIGKYIEELGGIEEFRKRENEKWDEDEKRLEDRYNELPHNKPVTIDIKNMSKEEILNIFTHELDKYHDYTKFQLDALKLRSKLNRFICLNILDFLFLDDDGCETTEYFILRALNEWLTLKNAENSKKFVPFSISDLIANKDAKQVISYVGETIAEDIFERIKDSEDREFDIIFSVVPRK